MVVQIYSICFFLSHFIRFRPKNRLKKRASLTSDGIDLVDEDNARGLAVDQVRPQNMSFEVRKKLRLASPMKIFGI